MKKLLLLPLLVSNLHSMEIVPVSSKENVRLLTNHKHMYIEDENAAYRIKEHDMNKEMRDVLKHKALGKFKEAGYIRAHKQSDGTYTLCAKVRGNGGGPILSLAVYASVQVLGFAGLMTGAVVANTIAPGAGTVATGIALGAGGIAGATASIQGAALTAGAWAMALPTP